MQLTNSQLVVAALTHDIGKLYQRAKAPLGEFADAKSIYLPFQKKGQGYYSHEHALHTAKWLKHFISDDEDFIKISALHHQPDINEPELIHWIDLIKRADRLASGLDRNDYPDDYDGKTANYKNTRLHSVFNRLFDYQPVKEGIYPLTRQDENDYFPIDFSQKQNQESEAEYQALVRELETQLRHLPSTALNVRFANRLLNIFEASLTTIPAATNAYPDHSLYDHSKVVAAIAGCLYSAHDQESPFLLVEADTSGIQQFIFEVTEGEQTRKHVAKSLRGRSTFMTLLTEFVASYLIQALELTAVHVLYSSGGTCQLLLPNTPEAKAKLATAQKQITQVLFDQFHTRLGVVFAEVAMTDAQLKNDYGRRLWTLKQKMHEQKERRFHQLMSASETTFFVSEIPQQDEQLCTLCAVKRTTKERCSLCEQLVLLGELVTDQTNYTIEFIFGDEQVPENRVFDFAFADLGRIVFHNQAKSEADYACVINEAKQGLKVKTIGNALPKQDGETLSFEEMANSSKGSKRLGVLKMDVDNLGFVFACGFNRELQSISRITTMSRQFDWFFTSYINDLCEQVSQECDYDDNRFYVTYAGGDDLLVVGPWDAMLLFAQTLQREFSAYTHHHPQVTLSAGLAIMKPKQPIRVAASEAEQLLQLAKAKPNKNAIAILDTVFPWEAPDHWSYEQLLEDFEYFSEHSNEISNTLFYNLAMISTQTTNQVFGPADYGLVPNIAYTMKRNLKSQPAMYQELKSRLLIADQSNQLPYIQYPFKLVILSQRN